MAKANVSIVEAQMGEGKTNTVTAIGVDYFFELIYAIRSPNPPFRIYKVECVKPVRPDIILLKEMKQPALKVNVKTNNAFIGENQQFNNNVENNEAK